jgi:hypothetical protein
MGLVWSQPLGHQLPPELVQFHFGLVLGSQQHLVEPPLRLQFGDHLGSEPPPVLFGHPAKLGEWLHKLETSVHCK